MTAPLAGGLAPGSGLRTLSVGVVSFGLLVNEIMLSAIFHVLLGAGNTVAAIAIALVGLSAGGIVAFSTPRLNRVDNTGALSGTLLFWFAVALIFSVFAIMAVPISHGDLIYFRSDPSVQLWRMAVYQITVIPFFLGGITLAVLFRSEPGRIASLYFADLFGAALGCVASPIAMWVFGAPGAVLFGAIPAALLGIHCLRRVGGPRLLLALIPVALLSVAVAQPRIMAAELLGKVIRGGVEGRIGFVGLALCAELNSAPDVGRDHGPITGSLARQGHVDLDRVPERRRATVHPTGGQQRDRELRRSVEVVEEGAVPRIRIRYRECQLAVHGERALPVEAETRQNVQNPVHPSQLRLIGPADTAQERGARLRAQNGSRDHRPLRPIETEQVDATTLPQVGVRVQAEYLSRRDLEERALLPRRPDRGVRGGREEQVGLQ